MSLSTPEARETVTTLRDRLKHGQNMTKILESQLDTAQQNISLLQGQVRLANETILNLKKYFQETENTINELLSPHSATPRKFTFENHKDAEEVTSSSKNSVNSETRSRSPRTPESSSDSNKNHHEEKRESHNKSPYAQQLRQVLDVLQDEEPRKTAAAMHHNDKDCNDCNDCHQTHSRPSSSKSYHENEHYQRKTANENDYCKLKHKVNGHSECHEQASPKSPYYRRSSESNPHHGAYGGHCMGPCCQSDSPGGYKMMEKPGHYIENEKSPHYIEKSPSGVHYIAVRSPERDIKHSDRHHGHHINYAYAYHIPDNQHKAMHHEVPSPMSPTGRRKRPYMPILPNEEPPHLKYTKVKRIDGSKLTAQKVLQDFTKRRFISYNPRYDLDLLIVPPPVPASDLMKSAGAKGLQQHSAQLAHENKTETPPRHENGRQQMYPDSDSISPRDNGDDVFTEPQRINDSNDNNNNNSIHGDNNNNNEDRNNKVPWVPKQSMFSTKGVDVLPSIKEEPRSKLDDQISKLRNEQVKNHYYQQTSSNNSPYNDSNNNMDSPSNNMIIHERDSPSPVPVMNRRTEQYCN